MCRVKSECSPGFQPSQTDWAGKISIPSRFSVETNTALTSGVLTSKARDEIVKSLSTLMLVHTMHPTSDDYNTVCSRLIKKHPVLKDHIGSGYVSVKLCKNGNMLR